MRTHLARLSIAAVISLTMAATAVSTAAAAKPDSSSSGGPVVVADYFECNGAPINAEWTITHHLTYFFDANGTPIRDIEKVSFAGVFRNPANGNAIADSGLIVYFDTLAPDYSYLTTMQNVVRKSEYFHAAGRTDFQTGRFTGMDNWEVGLSEACAALGA